MFWSLNRSCWTLRAVVTRSRISSEPSPGGLEAKSAYFTAGASMWISMRSSSGPEIFET